MIQPRGGSKCHARTILRGCSVLVRIIRRNPVIATIAIPTLALGIGVNSAIFGLFDAVLLRLLPVRDPQQLYLLQETGPNASSEAVSFPMFQRSREALKALRICWCSSRSRGSLYRANSFPCWASVMLSGACLPRTITGSWANIP